jgi:hypothetical protein
LSFSGAVGAIECQHSANARSKKLISTLTARAMQREDLGRFRDWVASANVRFFLELRQPSEQTGDIAGRNSVLRHFLPARW